MSREQQLSETFVKLADTLVTVFDVNDLLYHLIDRCVELFDVDHAGLMLAEPSGILQVLAATNEATYMIELLQVQNEEGPCLDTFRSGHLVIAPDLTTTDAQERWPQFSQYARMAGFNSMVALPMRLREDVIGALNLFRAEPGQIPGEDLSAAQALADVATIGLLQERAVRDNRLVIGQLQVALDSRIVIEQAKGVIAQYGGHDMEKAFAYLRQYARDHRQHLSDVARRIVDRDLDPGQLTTNP